MKTVNNTALLQLIENRMMGDKMLNAPDYGKVNAFYQDVLKSVPRGSAWQFCEQLGTKLRLVVEEINRAESKMVSISMTIGQFEQLIGTLETLEVDASVQYNALSSNG